MGVAFQQENSTVFCVIASLPQMFTKCTRGKIINVIRVFWKGGKQRSLICRIYRFSKIQAEFWSDHEEFRSSLKWNNRWMPVHFSLSRFASFLVNCLSGSAFLLFPFFFPFSSHLSHPLFFNPLSHSLLFFWNLKLQKLWTNSVFKYFCFFQISTLLLVSQYNKYCNSFIQYK